jgi:hypothetical protein
MRCGQMLTTGGCPHCGIGAFMPDVPRVPPLKLSDIPVLTSPHIHGDMVIIQNGKIDVLKMAELQEAIAEACEIIDGVCIYDFKDASLANRARAFLELHSPEK